MTVIQKKISTGHEPRPQQRLLHAASGRFKVLVTHRRFGKTVFAVNELISGAARCKLREPRFAYLAPFHIQAKDVAWSYLKRYTANIPNIAVTETELWVELPPRIEHGRAAAGARIRLYGADNADRLRGLYFDGVVLDEYAQMHPRVWSEVVRPALADRQGWALFIGTPMGRNGFCDLFEGARDGFPDSDGARSRDPDWAAFMFKSSETGIIPAAELEAARRAMTPDQYAQEFECSFDAAIPGAYYAQILADAERLGRVRSIPYEPALPVHTGWDLGIGDPLPADTLEGGFDRAVMRDQQLKDASDRALTFPPTIPPGVSAELPNPQADALLGWNSAADAIENKTLEPGTTVYASVPNTNAGLATHEAVTPYGLANSNLAAAVAAATAGLAALALPTGYFNGFTLANNGIDATHDIDVAAGKARSDADASNLTTSATVVKQTDVAFAEYVAPGTASGGMDSTTALTGAPATVHVFMIGGAGKNTQPFFSTNISPTLPSGFTTKVYVNSLWWDGATLRPFKQRGRDEIELVTITTASIIITTNPATGARTITLGQFPTGLELMAKLELFSSNNTAAALTGLSPLDVTDQNPASATGMFDVYTITNAAGQVSANIGWVKTNSSGQIRARTNASGAANVEQIATLGWRVMR